ncbi:MAG: DUF3592 domain-containing protein [Phycisphaerae bacterium]|nr:DUF3592 domain-containing protein [Phycisphaerae bacterium]MDD5381925.1 DUF3592 domain-containing protein [Phycisphaerae bacterium]
MILLVGSIIGICYAILSTAVKVKKVNNWVPTRCVVDSVYVDIDPSTQDDILFWNIHYTYKYNGQEYASNRYNILRRHIIITREEGKRITTERLKRGQSYTPRGPYLQGEETGCFVNPDNPAEAVLSQEYTFVTFLINKPVFIAVTIFILIAGLYYEFR